MDKRDINDLKRLFRFFASQAQSDIKNAVGMQEQVRAIEEAATFAKAMFLIDLWESKLDEP